MRKDEERRHSCIDDKQDNEKVSLTARPNPSRLTRHADDRKGLRIEVDVSWKTREPDRQVLLQERVKAHSARKEDQWKGKREAERHASLTRGKQERLLVGEPGIVEQDVVRRLGAEREVTKDANCTVGKHARCRATVDECRDPDVCGEC